MEAEAYHGSSIAQGGCLHGSAQPQPNMLVAAGRSRRAKGSALRQTNRLAASQQGRERFSELRSRKSAAWTNVRPDAVDQIVRRVDHRLERVWCRESPRVSVRRGPIED